MSNKVLPEGKRFSSDYQPKNRRQSTKILTDLLTKRLNKKTEIIIEGIDVETGEKRKFRLENPNKETIIMVLLREAAKGEGWAVKEIFNRLEGLPALTGEIALPGISYIGFDNTLEE